MNVSICTLAITVGILQKSMILLKYLLVGASFQSLHLYCQIPNGEVNLSIWSVNWYCLSTILLAIQVTVNNWNLNPYPILSYYILLNLLKIKKNWNIVDLQCVSFRCTTKWFSYTYICIFLFASSSILGYYKILSIVPCAIQ